MSDLKTWLTAHGIKFRSKDKKSDLVSATVTCVSERNLTFP